MTPEAPDPDVFVGIDMAKGDHFAQAMGRDGAELFKRAVRNDETAIVGLINEARGHGASVAFVVDQPASGAQLLLSLAAAHGVQVAYVTGLQMRRAADLYAGRAKTDPIDAWVLADFARRNVDRLCWLEVTDDLLVELRILNGRDVDLAADATRAINRCRDAITAISPALERAIGPRLGHGGVRDVLAKWPTPTLMRVAGRARIRARMAKRSPRLASKLTVQICNALDAQDVTLPGEGVWGRVIADLCSELDRIITRREQLATEIEQVFVSHPLGAVLVTLCGFGPRTAARTLAEIGDPNRFADGGRLAAYAGLAPVDRRSGRSINSASKSRGGNHRLKNAMFLAEFVAAQHDPIARAYYQRKRAEGKRHNAAVICLARKRCDLILAMLKTATPYDVTRHQSQSEAA